MSTQDQSEEQQPSKDKKKAISSKPSKPSLTLEQAQKNLHQALRDLADAAGDPIPKACLDTQMPLDMLGNEDVMLRVDIRAYTKEGEAFRVSGISTAPHILSDSMHLEAARNFEELYHATVTRPSLNRFNSFLNKYTRSQKDDREEGTKFLASRNPSEDQGYISDTD